MNRELSKSYNPSEFEDEIYKNWENKGYFKPEVNGDAKPYTIVMPPPNITGQLHLGHAFDGTLQDIIIRWKRMQGYSALWLPGTDHASIATEVKVVEKIKEEENKTKEDLGRDVFLERAWDWAIIYKKRIVDQFKKLGASCDWDRERFTMDEGCTKAVTETFVRLYDKGLIYRGNRIINWCPDCKTALSDAEVEYEEKAGKLYHLKYPIEGTNEYLVVATTRPETMLGDSGVAVNPNDDRYKDLVGKFVILPLVDRRIPIIADDYVDMEFGTGAVKMTPAHDPNDFEVGLRHDLAQIKVLDDSGVMNENAGKYKGLDRYEARKIVMQDLETANLVEKIEERPHNVGSCYRCDTVVEPLISQQWFVNMKPLAEPAIDVVRENKTRFIPDRFSKIYFNWMENIKDWCISRQLWWGHRIPAYYCQECGEVIVSATAVSNCSKCGSSSVVQDEDVLDTWFSSALWPFSTLGWPDETPDLKKFYPNDLLVTGFDIIFFWVARMIFSGIEQMGETPFSDVYIHGLIRDAQGRKMSKSLGNGVDPLEVIEEYGADPLRFTIVTGNAAGNDIRWNEEKVLANRNFANKIWNASKFVIMHTKDVGALDLEASMNDLLTMDKWIISRLNQVTREINENLEKYELGIAAQKLYDFMWNEYCDWYIELVKPRLYNEDSESKKAALSTLHYVLETSLKLLHPFMPFITEKLFLAIQEKEETIMISKWPEFDPIKDFKEEESQIAFVMDIVRAVRNIKAELNVAPSKKVKLYIRPFDEMKKASILDNDIYIKNLANAVEIVITESKDIPDNASAAMVDGAEIVVPLDELIDKEKEIDRLEKEKETLEKEIDRVVKKLSNQGFISKAPQKVVDEEKAKEEKYRVMYENVLKTLESYKK
ncbi:valine--tRNA ligase [Alkalibacter mobilis]|uniref:valine--tRNA ligase n=1 Tax=Alkalibacter mobilis TaxID=2787712 RepID=UPI0018A07B07|nr:valine--tRNA ligase [Alkalibacter mobilis]MBF7097726.1 valine--tRNA ligase [Alkalibacter mobilis]